MSKSKVIQKKLYIVAGHNGAGKTTFLKNFLIKHKISYINADEIAEKIENKKGSNITIDAGRIALKRLDNYLKHGRSFAVETTFSGKIWGKLLRKFNEKGYDITIYFIYLNSPVEAINRIKVRSLKKGHFIPDDIVFRRYSKSLRNFWHSYKNYSNKWYLLNNSNHEMIIIAEGVSHTFNIEDPKNFKLFSEIIKK